MKLLRKVLPWVVIPLGAMTLVYLAAGDDCCARVDLSCKAFQESLRHLAACSSEDCEKAKTVLRKGRHLVQCRE